MTSPMEYGGAPEYGAPEYGTPESPAPAPAAASRAEINYADTGGDGPAVVLSHGFLTDQSMFAPQVKALAPEFRVVTWDQRGHGWDQSGHGGTPARGPFSYWDSARDLLALLDHLGVQRAVLGGLSQGGFVSLRAALLAPGRVRGLILIDTQAGQQDPAVAPAYEHMHEVWREQGPGPVQEVISSIILGPGQWDDWYAKWAATDIEQFTPAFRCLMDRDDITGRLGEIGCPALIVHGTADAVFPLAKAGELRDGLGGSARLAVIEGGTHASNMSHPAEVSTEMLNFLRELDRP
jgi:3-oxoadipate enol-lactonase